MTLSDPVFRYVLDARPLYEELRRALVQLSGHALKRATDTPNAVLEPGPLDAARETLRECAERLAALRTPQAATHHRFHLDTAAAALDEALTAALSKSEADGDALFTHLETAERELRAASRLLPGFEVVDFRQACCACHTGFLAEAGQPQERVTASREG